MNFFLFFPEKKIGHSTNPLPKNARPHQLSGCKYKNVIPTPQNVLQYFFEIKFHKNVSACFSTLTLSRTLKFL